MDNNTLLLLAANGIYFLGFFMGRWSQKERIKSCDKGIKETKDFVDMLIKQQEELTRRCEALEKLLRPQENK